MTNQERLNKALNREPVDRIMTWDFVDNIAMLERFGGYVRGNKYSWEEMLIINVKMFKTIGLDMTRYIYDPVNHWMGSKIVNWIRFFGVNPDNWILKQAGDTAWIAKRPFNTLKGLEKNLPKPPKFDEVKDWYQPFIRQIKEVYDEYDLVFVGGVEGPVTDAYSYIDMELFALGLYDAPELISHVMDCTGMFSAHLAQIYSENASAPLLFMGEDICGCTGPIFSPDFLRREALPRWHWIMDPIKEKGYKFLFHTDGKYGEALPIIFEELGADGIHPVERNGLNDIFEIGNRYPDKLLFGNVCCEVTLPHGTIEDVEDETLELIERLGLRGGIFIGSSSEVHDKVPVENAVKMYETVKRYGKYPIDIERIKKRRNEIRGGLQTRKLVTS
ncbi:MAG: uroporphyrinogen decarboxylase family protein [Spirochaetota bacterium]